MSQRSFFQAFQDGDDPCAPPRRGPNAVRYYVRARLHRRLFVSLGIAVFFMLLSVAFAMHFFRPPGLTAHQMQPIESYLRSQFASAWEVPKERARLAAAAHEAFRVSLTLRDAKGAALERFGVECVEPAYSLKIFEGPKKFGSIDVCPPEAAIETRKALFAGLFAAAFALWLAAGMMAHRLGKPLWQLVLVTREIGHGKLESRARLGRHQPGEVGVLANSINEMAARLEKQMKDQRELLAAVSHEIRTPLARLRVLSEILRDGGAAEKTVGNVEREIAEIDDLTGQLLATSRLDFGTLEKVPLSLSELVPSVLERAGISADRIQLNAGTDLFVEGDATLLARAILNLIQNAETHGGGLTDVVVSREGAEIKVVFGDRGNGFHEEEVPRVFEAFFQGSSRKKSGSSLGLGLSLVRRIAEAHGGKVKAENRKAGGAEVGFSLPVREVPSAFS